MKCAIGSDNID